MEYWFLYQGDRASYFIYIMPYLGFWQFVVAQASLGKLEWRKGEAIITNGSLYLFEH